MKTVPLHGKVAAGRVALVDDEDYDLVMQYRWNVVEDDRRDVRRGRGPYAFTSTRKGAAKRGTILMHNLIMGRLWIDHINHYGLDNQRSNLRPATCAENQGNRRGKINGTSQYKGVYLEKRTRRWVAEINANGRKRWLGSFVSEVDAACAYDAAARLAYGKFACLNFPQSDSEVGALEIPDEPIEAWVSDDRSAGPDQAGTSRYLGVFWNTRQQRWQARVKRRHLGFHVSEIEAALAYDAAAPGVHGPNAFLNFPGGVSQEERDRLRSESAAMEAVAAIEGKRVRSAARVAGWAKREPETRVCTVCDGEYQSRSTQESLYCSKTCGDKVANRRKKERRSEKRRQKLEGRLF